jgi:hypothetical protein
MQSFFHVTHYFNKSPVKASKLKKILINQVYSVKNLSISNNIKAPRQPDPIQKLINHPDGVKMKNHHQFQRMTFPGFFSPLSLIFFFHCCTSKRHKSERGKKTRKLTKKHEQPTCVMYRYYTYWNKIVYISVPFTTILVGQSIKMWSEIVSEVYSLPSSRRSHSCSFPL